MAGASPLNIANVSAMATAAGAPTPLSMGAQKNSAVGSNQPPQNQNPPNHPVSAHADTKSVGTHPSQSPDKRSNPVHGMSK